MLPFVTFEFTRSFFKLNLNCHCWVYVHLANIFCLICKISLDLAVQSGSNQAFDSICQSSASLRSFNQEVLVIPAAKMDIN